MAAILGPKKAIQGLKTPTFGTIISKYYRDSFVGPQITSQARKEDTYERHKKTIFGSNCG